MSEEQNQQDPSVDSPEEAVTWLDDAAWEEFISILSSPVQANPNLVRLFSKDE